ncbi:MAG: methionyl-tRNA formyltransferase [Deferrisomatales bacterium]
MGSPPGPLLFLGTSAFAVPSLEALVAAGERVVRVVTQPDRPRGRGRRPEPSPVKAAAVALGLDVVQPDNASAPETLALLSSPPPEFLAVVSYGQLLRRPLLELPARGAVNVHPSLLPRHRGPSPVAWSLLSGDPEVGVSTMLLDEGMDSGPVLLQERFPLDPAFTRGEVDAFLAREGARLLVETLAGLRSGAVEPRAQDAAGATLSRLLTRELRVVDWGRGAAQVRGLVHALSPAPGAEVRLRGRLVKLLRVRVVPGEGGVPGSVVAIAPDGPVVACGEGAVALVEVHPEGRRPMTGAEFARGGGAAPGDRAEVPWDG